MNSERGEGNNFYVKYTLHPAKLKGKISTRYQSINQSIGDRANYLPTFSAATYRNYQNLSIGNSQYLPNSFLLFSLSLII